jgi:hypothetical protein
VLIYLKDNKQGDKMRLSINDEDGCLSVFGFFLAFVVCVSFLGFLAVLGQIEKNENRKPTVEKTVIYTAKIENGKLILVKQ